MLVKKFAIMALAIFPCFLGTTRVGEIKKFITNFSYIGPFVEGADDYTLSGLVTPTVTIGSVKETMKVYVIDGPIVKTEAKTYHSVTKNNEYTLTFTLPFKSALTKKGLKVDITFINGKDELLQSLSFNIKPIQPQRINVRDYYDTYLVINDIVVDPDRVGTYSSEKYKFNQFIDYFNVDSYYRLRLDNIYITYDSVKACPLGSAHLHFVDYLKLFPYLDSDEEVPTFDIPLSTRTSNNGVFFTFPSIMYVKPQSLEMSLVARPGFVSTKYFYLPVNHCRDLLDQTFTLVVDSFGHNRNSFSWDIRYINNRNLIGDCSTSDYCVVGEVNNG